MRRSGYRQVWKNWTLRSVRQVTSCAWKTVVYWESNSMKWKPWIPRKNWIDTIRRGLKQTGMTWPGKKRNRLLSTESLVQYLFDMWRNEVRGLMRCFVVNGEDYWRVTNLTSDIDSGSTDFLDDRLSDTFWLTNSCWNELTLIQFTNLWFNS